MSHRKSKVPATIVAILTACMFIIIGIIFIMFGALFDKLFPSDYDTVVNGIVTDVIEEGTDYKAEYEFNVGDKTYIGQTSVTSSSESMWNENDPITIYYDSQNPNKNDDKISVKLSTIARYLFMFIGAVTCFFGIVGGIIAVVKINKKKDTALKENVTV